MSNPKRILLVVAVVVFVGCSSMDQGTETDSSYGSSISDNLSRFRSTNSCPGCDLRGVDLDSGFLGSANLSGADLAGANLRNAMLVEANLSGASLRDANLTGARLRGANLSGADLAGANVYGANFLGVKGLSPEQVDDLKKRGAVFHGPSF